MNLKLNFVKNPRYRENIPPPLFTDDDFQPIDSPNNAFSVNPKIVIFKDYQMGSVYQIDVKILNRTQLLTSFKYIPPHTENFTIKDIIYPKRDSALIAPGMNARIQVLFHATSMDNFEDDITIVTERMKFKIPLKAIRDKPAITLINPMDCGKCFIGDRVEMHFTCKNNGGDAHFKFLPMENNPVDNEGNAISNNVPNELLNIPPFSIFPQEFYLYRGMSQNVSVTFIPTDEGIVERNLTLFCESAVLNYVLRGEGIKVDIIISKLDGLNMEIEDVGNEEEEKKENNEENNKFNNDF
jgi:hydrocephalus-inducing protein